MKSRIKISIKGSAFSFIILPLLLTSCACVGEPDRPVIRLTGNTDKPIRGTFNMEPGVTDSLVAALDSRTMTGVVKKTHDNYKTGGTKRTESLLFIITDDCKEVSAYSIEKVVEEDDASQKLNDFNLESVELECTEVDIKCDQDLTLIHGETDKSTVDSVHVAKEVPGEGGKMGISDSVNYNMADEEQDSMGKVTLEKQRKNHETSLKNSVIMTDSKGKTSTRKNNNTNVEGYGFILAPDNTDKFYEMFQDKDMMNTYMNEMGTFYRYLGESRENMIGLYANILNREVGVNIAINDVDLLRDGTTRLMPISYSFFVGHVLPPIKPEKPKYLKSVPDGINSNIKPAELLKNPVKSIKRVYGNIGVRADLGHDSYLSAKFNPFTYEASTYVNLKRTFYNDEGDKIVNISVKGAAQYYFEDQVWSAKVNAQVKVPFEF
jgi:hypothetical protein